MMQKLGGVLIVLFLAYYAIATYGKHQLCTEAGGVLVAGIGWFECVQPVKHGGV
jgi:hypothetical protein